MNKTYFDHLVDPRRCALVVGAGRSGIASTKLLLAHGHRVLLIDDNEQSALRFLSPSGLEENDALSFLFNQPLTSLDQVSFVVTSPGVPLNHRAIAMAKHNHIPVFSEIDVGMCYLGDKHIIGITGTNGKSSTTVMMEGVLKAFGLKAVACGNLGQPLCDVVHSMNHDLDYVVLELSSFQLETSSYLNLDGAIIVNISPDHLDRHKTFAEYQAAKLSIASFLKPYGHLVANDELMNSLAHDQRATFFNAGMFGQN
jgi:UDP-N-acetylmuramoylalanine--D-glutamate ligase